MSDTLIAAALLGHSSIAALVGERIALKQLDQGEALPALVYSIPSSNTTAYLAAGHETGKGFMRLQVNPLAQTSGEVEAIHAAVHQALAWRCAEEVAGHWLTHVEPGPYADWSKHQETGAWTRPRDYLIHFEA